MISNSEPRFSEFYATILAVPAVVFMTCQVALYFVSRSLREFARDERRGTSKRA